jgi:hypothetical protein
MYVNSLGAIVESKLKINDARIQTIIKTIIQGRYMNKYFLLPFILSSSSVIATTELPPILDYYPKCEPQVIDVVSNKINYDVKELYGQESSEVDQNIDLMSFKGIYVNKAFLDIRSKAKLAGADAVIIDKLVVRGFNRIIAKEEKRENVFDRNAGDRVKSKVILEKIVKNLLISTTVKNIKLCDDKSLTSKATPYNSKGLKIVVTSVVLSKFKSEGENLLIKAGKHEAPKSEVTVDSAYGVKIGATLSSLKNAMGPESIHLSMNNYYKAYGYGRSLWFIIKDDKVSMIYNNYDFLNGHGKNQIIFSENYDKEDWNIEGMVHSRDELESVKTHLTLNAENSDYVMLGDKTKLVFKFENFNPEQSSESVNLLNGYMILPRMSKKQDLHVKYDDFNNIDINSILSFNYKNKYKLTSAQLSNEIQLNRSGVWVVANENLLLGVDTHGVINKVRITESIFNEQGIDKFHQVLASYQVPIVKADFLKRYPDAVDEIDSVSMQKDNIILSASFASYDDDAPLIDLVLEIL